MKLSTNLLLLLLLAGFAASASAQDGDKKCHLFILSGQSNMAGLKPAISFTPAVEKAFGAENVVVVKDAQGGQPIRRWYKNWSAAIGDKGGDAEKQKNYGDLYERLIEKVKAELGSKKPDSITFVWMQGEKDARERLGEFYSASFRGVVDQLKSDLGRKDINFVIGRLSDFDNENKRYPHWTRVREEQVKLAEGDAVGEWVDTDDLNGKGNGLHYDKEGYRVLGERFAEKAIKLVNEPKEK